MVTADTRAAAYGAAKPGDVLALEGVFEGLSRPPNGVTLDLTAATINGNTRWDKPADITVKGGLFTSRRPLHCVDGVNVTLDGSRAEGDPIERDASAFAFVRGKNLTVRNVSAKSYRNVLTVREIDTFDIDGVDGDDILADVVHATAMWRGRIVNVQSVAPRPQGDAHPDVLQLISAAGLPPTCDVVLAGIKGQGDTNGILLTDKDGMGGYDRITILGVDMALSRPMGLSATNVRGLVLGYVSVETLGAVQAKIVMRGCTGVAYVGPVTHAAGAGKAAVSFNV